MNRNIPAGVAVAAFLFFAFPVSAQRGGMGHSFGGHSGFSGGHPIGHSVGHSFGHLFGRSSGVRGKGPSRGRANSAVPPLAGAAIIRGRVVQLPGPQGVLVDARLRRAPLREFGFRRRFHDFGFAGNSFFGFCGSFGEWPRRRMSLSDGFDCFQHGFLFDPFFLAGFDPFTLDTSEPPVPVAAHDLTGPPDEAQPPNQEPLGELRSPSGNQPLSQDLAAAPADTLLQLTNGSMYALTSYWLEDGRLHYVTSYGGENSVPLSQIDFDKTMQLNAAQGLKFEIHARSSGDRTIGGGHAVPIPPLSNEF